MKIAIKYLICIVGFIAAFYSFDKGGNIGAGITCAASFFTFALLEVNDLKILNDNEE